MRINAQASFQWQEINKRIQGELNCQSRVFLYQSFNQAVFEVLLGLHFRYPQKKKIVTDLGFADHTKTAEVELARLGVRLKDKFNEDIQSEESEVLAYVHDMDDAITAELYNHLETLKKLAGIKVMRVHLAHHLLQERQSFINKLSDYDIVIAALDYDLALVFTGEKVSFPFLGVATQPWDAQRDWPDLLKRLRPLCPTYEKAIERFESSLPEGVRPFFTDRERQRLYDRSLVILEDFEGSALVDLLQEKLKLPASHPSEHSSLESVSYSRWQNQSWFDQAKKMNKTENEMRGLVLIHGSLLNEEFQKTFLQCLKELKILSS